MLLISDLYIYIGSLLITLASFIFILRMIISRDKLPKNPPRGIFISYIDDDKYV